MNSFERTVGFIEGNKVDRVPFHPIMMRFAAIYAGVRYRDFCLSSKHKCMANIKCATDFHSDWVNTMSDPYAEAEAFGTLLSYPDNDLPQVKQYALREIRDIDRLTVKRVSEHSRLQERVREIEEYRLKTNESFLICGWVEGPLAEYCDIRDINSALTDLYEYPDKVHQALDVITENAIGFINEQVEAGAHCIGIGDSVCSLISPELYYEFCHKREKALVDYIHSKGAFAKIHICGDISAILEGVIRTGTDIIDIDHRVDSVKEAAALLSPGQVFSGKSDPVSVIQDGEEQVILDSVASFYEEAGRRAIVSGGCEITPGTSTGNMRIFGDAARYLQIT